MSREIKFRAWDKITKRYYSVETWHMEDEYVDLIESNKSTADPNAKRFWRRISEVILEQFTGLKDVNGKEIYEGDIIHSAYNDNDFYSVVVFDNGKFYGKNTILPNLELRIVSVGSGYHFISPIEYYYYDMYISGDIHNNPELLEADK